jgi:hypothetical protein
MNFKQCMCFIILLLFKNFFFFFVLIYRYFVFNFITSDIGRDIKRRLRPIRLEYTELEIKKIVYSLLRSLKVRVCPDSCYNICLIQYLFFACVFSSCIQVVFSIV